MKILKYLAILLMVLVLVLFVYTNFIVYLIPYNPFIEFSQEELESVYFEGFYTEGGESKSQYMVSENIESSKLVFQYFKELKLKPRKSNKIQKDMEASTRISGGFIFGPPSNDHTFINDLFQEEPSVFYISFKNDKFKSKSGYYEILDEELDFGYIDSLMKDD